MTDSIDSSNSDTTESPPAGPPGNKVVPHEYGKVDPENYKKKFLNWIKKPPLVVTIILALLATVVTAILIPYMQAIFSELRNLNNKVGNVEGQLAVLKPSFDNQIAELRKDIVDERKRVNELTNNLGGLKAQIVKADLKNPFSVAIVSTKSEPDSGGNNVQKTHVIDGYSNTICTYLNPVDDESRGKRSLLIGRAFEEDVTCNSFRRLCDLSKGTNYEIDFPPFVDQEASFLFRKTTTSRVMKMLPHRSPQQTTLDIRLEAPNLISLAEELNRHPGKYAVFVRTSRDVSSELLPYENRNALRATLVSLATIKGEENQTADAERIYNESISLARESGDTGSSVMILYMMAMMQMMMGEQAKASEQLSKTFEISAFDLSMSPNAQAADERWDQFDTRWKEPFQPSQELMSELRKSAEEGDTSAQYNLAVMYLRGIGVDKDYAEAQRWSKRAAEGGLPEAQFSLGVMYRRGLGVPMNHKEALKWFIKAAEQGYAAAQDNLGVMYRDGKGGLPKDDKEAVKWFGKAAAQGHADSQNNLGRMYFEGRGVPRDHIEALKWYAQAAKQGDALAKNNIGWTYLNRLDYDKALQWFREAAEQGNARAETNLGWMYEKGWGVSQNYRDAFSLYRKAAEKGLGEAQKSLGELYRDGKGVPTNRDEAIKWFKLAAEQGNEKAQTAMREMGVNP